MVTNGGRTAVTIAILIATSVTVANGQSQTIPELLAEKGRDAFTVRGIPSGAPPQINDLLSEVDRVVSGTVGQSRAYLSPDQHEVYSDYTIDDPVILYDRQLATSERPGLIAPVTVTLVGGTVTYNNLTFTDTNEALPSLDHGVRCLFLLKRVDGKYRVVGGHYGAFRVSDNALIPLTRKQGFGLEYRNTPAAEAQNEIVGRLLARRR